MEVLRIQIMSQNIILLLLAMMIQAQTFRRIRATTYQVNVNT